MGTSRIERERLTIEAMIRLYCRRRHGTGAAGLCPGCWELLEYASARLRACRFGEGKPACSKCPIHCYKPDMRERVRAVMRWSGPRMLWRHPALAIRHLAASRARGRARRA